MAYLVFFAAVRGLQDFSCLEKIPQSMPWRAYRLLRCDLVLLEWIKRPNRNNPPPLNMIQFPERPEFARRPAAIDLPDRFGANAPELDDLYERLLNARRAGTLPKVAVQSALLLSEITGCPVLSIASDDEEWDLACEAQSGALAWLRFDAELEDVCILADGSTQSGPVPDQKVLHRIAQSAAATWCEDLNPLFGFDGDVAAVPMVEVARVDLKSELPALARGSSVIDQVPSRSKRSRPFWKFW